MDDNLIEITINGTTYYIPAEQLQYLKYVDNKLVNISDHTIYLVSRFSTNTVYPRISCSSMAQCRYYQSASVDYSGVTSNYEYTGKFNINTIGQYGISSYILMILLIILGVKLIWKR